MKKIEVFEPLFDVSGCIRPDGQEMIVSGAPHELARMKKYLTVENDSVKFRISQIQRTLAKGCRYEDKLRQELKELQKDAIREYYAELSPTSLSCPPGLWWLCKNIKGHRGNIPYADLPEINGRKPRSYQIEAVKELLKYKRAMLSLTTGGGKTIITAQLCYCFLRANKRVLVIVPTIELSSQTSSVLEQYFPGDVCAIGGKSKWKPGALIYVSTINSAKNAIDVVDVVIQDESHHSSAQSYTDSLLLASQAEYVLGLTATPTRADNMVLGVHAMCGPVVYSRDVVWGVQNGFLCPASINMVHISGLGAINAMDVLSAIAYKKLCKHQKTLKTLHSLIKKALDHGLNTMVLFKTEGAGSVLAEYLGRNGIAVQAAHSKYRVPLIAFKKGETKLLVSNSALLGEGVDIPKIDCIIDVTQAASESQIRQILGRGLRPCEGKTRLLFFSVVLHGYGKWKNGETRIWQDTYGGYAEVRKRIYHEISEVKTINI